MVNVMLSKNKLRTVLLNRTDEKESDIPDTIEVTNIKYL